MSSRDLILSRVHKALADVPQDEAADVARFERIYLRQHGGLSQPQLIDLLADNLADYRARVHRCGEGDLATVIGRLLSDNGTHSVLTPPGIPETWLAHSAAARVEESAALTSDELDAIDSVITGCALAIAETGTIVLDGGPGQGRRRTTLITDHHICVIRAPAQVVASVPHALERLDPATPLTWISGPSATSDIELDRVEGVHGPRHLDVVIMVATAT